MKPKLTTARGRRLILVMLLCIALPMLWWSRAWETLLFEVSYQETTTGNTILGNTTCALLRSRVLVPRWKPLLWIGTYSETYVWDTGELLCSGRRAAAPIDFRRRYNTRNWSALVAPQPAAVKRVTKKFAPSLKPPDWLYNDGLFVDVSR